MTNLPQVSGERALPAITKIALVIAGLCFSNTTTVIAQTIQPDRNLVVQAAPRPAGQGMGTQRVALVVGNGSYKDSPLANPVNDARAVQAALKESGFTVIYRENIDQRGMLAALREFGDQLRGGGGGVGTGLFYYAGHGMQIKGRNYLIPVGSNVEREDEVAYGAVDAQAVLDKMEAAGNATNIMILDACRNNPFIRASRSGAVGLAQMDAPIGTLVAFATSPGNVASDGTGQNGLYTQHLLTAMRQPGVKLEDVFKQVRANVRRDSQNKQVPWESTSLEGDFYFKAAAEVPQSGEALETALWDAVKNTPQALEVRIYLNRYPQGHFVAQAQARLKQLEPTAAPVAATLPLKIPAPPAAAVANSAATQTTLIAPLPGEGRPENAQAEFDRRTAELLVSLAAASANKPNTSVAPPAQIASARPAPQTNSAGYTTGDRWRYQTVDKFKQEVINNWSRNVEGVNPDGSLKLNGGFVSWNGRGDIAFVKGSSNDYLREYSPPLSIVPTSLAIGHSQRFSSNLVWRNAGGNNGTSELSGSLKVVGKEQVKIPAGEFSALRVEMAGFSNVKNISTNNAYTSSFKEVFWYVPELRNFVAKEYEERNQIGAIQTFTRDELTSFSVRGAIEALARR